MSRSKSSGNAVPEWLGDRGIALLAAVAEHGSITRAAKAVGISYRTAWERLESLNNLSQTPLVSRSCGGWGGGGTCLTTHGLQLLAAYRQLADEQARLLERLSRETPELRGLTPTLRPMTLQTSARNQYQGTVRAVARGAVNAEITVDLGNGQQVVAVITEESVERLGLAVGHPVLAIIKASWVTVTTDPSLKVSARNRLCGTVVRLETGAVNSDVVIDLGGGKSLSAVITNDSAKQLELAAGQHACGIFKASSVILGVRT